MHNISGVGGTDKAAVACRRVVTFSYWGQSESQRHWLCTRPAECANRKLKHRSLLRNDPVKNLAVNMTLQDAKCKKKKKKKLTEMLSDCILMTKSIHR